MGYIKEQLQIFDDYNPKGFDERLGLAKAYIGISEYNKAEKILASLPEEYGDEVHYWRAIIDHKRGDNTDAHFSQISGKHFYGILRKIRRKEVIPGDVSCLGFSKNISEYISLFRQVSPDDALSEEKKEHIFAEISQEAEKIKRKIKEKDEEKKKREQAQQDEERRMRNRSMLAAFIAIVWWIAVYLLPLLWMLGVIIMVCKDGYYGWFNKTMIILPIIAWMIAVFCVKLFNNMSSKLAVLWILLYPYTTAVLLYRTYLARTEAYQSSAGCFFTALITLAVIGFMSFKFIDGCVNEEKKSYQVGFGTGIIILVVIYGGYLWLSETSLDAFLNGVFNL